MGPQATPPANVTWDKKIVSIIIIIISHYHQRRNRNMPKDMKPTWPYRCILKISETPAGRLHVCVSMLKYLQIFANYFTKVIIEYIFACLYWLRKIWGNLNRALKFRKGRSNDCEKMSQIWNQNIIRIFKKYRPISLICRAQAYSQIEDVE